MQVRAYQKEKGPAPMHVGYMHILQELLSTAVQVLIRHSCLFKKCSWRATENSSDTYAASELGDREERGQGALIRFG
jgi:hypothetical protein